VAIYNWFLASTTDYTWTMTEQTPDQFTFRLQRGATVVWRSTVELTPTDAGTRVDVEREYPWMNLPDLLAVQVQKWYEGRVFELHGYRMVSRNGSVSLHIRWIDDY
jgi:hypothetical protein